MDKRSLVQEAIEAAKNGDVAEALDKLGVPELPPNLVEITREMSNEDMLAFELHYITGAFYKLLGVSRAAMQRCGVCRDSDGGPCGHCTAATLVLHEILAQILGLARMLQAAHAPGTRISAVLEAREEQKRS